jgi:Asp-tRNA(Asn)/Glu-tRNA(Gln) amidotransferase A subunit family amidase
MADEPTRRVFLLASGAAAAAAALPSAARTAGPAAPPQPPVSVPPSPSPQPAAEEPITQRTLEEAQRLAAVRFTEAERTQALQDLHEQIERFRRRRTLPLENHVAPATLFFAAGPCPAAPPALSGGRVEHVPGPLPRDDRELAFAPISALSSWIRRGELSSERLVRLCLERLETLGPKLECVVTLLSDGALRAARARDRELAQGRWRGPLHGVPWGAKDLFDTARIATSWGAEPYRDRVPQQDSAVVRRLDEAGCVLVAKLSLGALAYGDIWFGGKTRNPWRPQEGSSGSSAGSAAAVAAGLVPFALGTETYGSIVSPCMRCGVTGLRPTFGRVPRTGAMALCWSLDKIGPICRTVEDCATVLEAINGRDPGDPCSVDVPFAPAAGEPARELRLGYDPAWFEGSAAHALDRGALEAARRLGFRMVELSLPQWPYESLLSILLVEAAAAFEELTLSDRDDELSWQEPQAWPNTFRQARFIPGIEYVQAQRFRRRVMEMMARTMEEADALIGPSFAGSLLLITNCTGHPSLTLRCGFTDEGAPRGITLWGRLYDEATLCWIGTLLERALGVADRRPPLEAQAP